MSKLSDTLREMAGKGYYAIRAGVLNEAAGKLDNYERVILEQDAEIKRLQLYERAIESMAKQFVNPKMTAEELARQQLGE